MEDALMSSYAMFSLKDPSMLAFERRRITQEHNLKTVYKLKAIPCDTQMRTILDPLPPDELRPAYNTILNALQRGKALEGMQYLEDGYLMLLEGTSVSSSEKLFSDHCQQKIRADGKLSYSLQMLGAALVHPERKEVIPLIPEIISRQDGSAKKGCELNASRRYLIKFKGEHPHLKIVVVQDAISPNGPYIRFVKESGYHFILTVKNADHAQLFTHFDEVVKKPDSENLIADDPKHPDRYHYFHWANGVAINASHGDTLVNVLEYYEVTGDDKKRFSWVTDIPLTKENVCRIMRAGRVRWKIENETFNTLKNQGYNFEHNYGLGKKYLSMVFVKMLMLAFLIDQTQQLCCTLFQAVLKKSAARKPSGRICAPFSVGSTWNPWECSTLLCFMGSLRRNRSSGWTHHDERQGITLINRQCVCSGFFITPCESDGLFS